MTGDTTATGEQQDATGPTDRLSVAEAAVRLGVSHDAIRARLRRGTLTGEKQGDEWIVLLAADQPQVEENEGQDADTPRQETDRPPDILIDQLREENAYLRDQLDQALRTAERERERADVLMREALQRLEALAPGPVAQQDTRQDATGSPESARKESQGSIHGDEGNASPAGLWARLWHAFRGS